MKRHQIPQSNSSQAAGSLFVSLNFFYSLVQIVFFWVTDRILHLVQSMVMKFLSQIHQKVNTLEKQSYVISLECIWEARTFLGVGPNGTSSTMYEYVSKVYWKVGTSTKECARIKFYIPIVLAVIIIQGHTLTLNGMEWQQGMISVPLCIKPTLLSY